MTKRAIQDQYTKSDQKQLLEGGPEPENKSTRETEEQEQTGGE